MVGQGGVRRSKYNARRVEADGHSFDSYKEFKRYCALKLLLKAGHISRLVVHPKFPIVISGAKVCTVELDTQYFDHKTKQIVNEDVKSEGTDTAMSRLKRKLVEALYGIKVQLYGLRDRSA